MTAGTFRTDTLVLAAASVVNAATAFGVAVIGLQTYGAEGFAPVALLWSAWALSVAATTFPLQHWVNWLGVSTGGLTAVRAARSAVMRYVIGVALVAAAVLWLLIPTFREEPTWALIAAVVVLGSGVIGWGRGVLAAKGHYVATATVMAGENVARFLAAVVVVAAGGGVVAFGWSIAIGPVILIPMRRWMKLPPPSGKVSIVAALGGLSAAVLVAQAFVQLAPVAAELVGAGEVGVSAVFATFAVARIPVLFALATVTRLTTPLAAIASARDRERHDRLVRWLGVSIVAVTPTTFVIGSTVGPSVVEWLFGPDTALSAGTTGLVAAGMWLAVVGVVLLVLHVTTETTVQAMTMWGIAGLVAVIVVLLTDDPTDAIAFAFFAGELTAVVASLGVHARGARDWAPAP